MITGFGISPYIVLHIVLLLCSLLSYIVKENGDGFYRLLLYITTIFLCLRYGQGSDYSMYEYLYYAAPTTFSFEDVYFGDAYHSEFGWKLLMVILRAMGIPFEFFIGILSLLMMYMLNRFIANHSENKCLSLLLAYPTLYLVYFFSAIRMGFVVSVFLGYLYDYIMERKTIRFILITILLSSIHIFAVVFLIVPIVIRIRFSNILWIMPLISLMIGLAPAVFPTYRAFMQSLPGIGYYYSTQLGLSFSGLMERAIMFTLIMSLSALYNRDKNNDDEINGMLSAYAIGFSIYCLFAYCPNVASRFNMTFKVFEIVLLPVLLNTVKEWKALVLSGLLLLVTVFTIKNLNAFIYERNYYSYISWINYPYITVFDNDLQIGEYRPPYLGRP